MPQRPANRYTRSAWRSSLLVVVLVLATQAALAFGFDDVAQQAAVLARAPYRAPAAAAAQVASLTYDQYRQIRFKPEQSLWHERKLPWQVQFFPTGRGFAQTLLLYEVADGQVSPLVVPRDAFDAGGVALSAAIDENAAIAGLRLLNRFNDGKQWDEVIAFLGASYFRALGAGQRYGASARAVAVDTVGPHGEEFPAFTTFWLERPAPGAQAAVLHALLDGPRVAGAYSFTVRPGSTTTVDVRARLYLRGAVAMLGIAPLSSMFLAGENQPAAGDFRPEVHDSDGLQLALDDGEWLWRPLVNPHGSFVTSFAAHSPRGFGLLQRDRAFASYEDLEAHYERRPSVWVEPLGDWGAGRVELLQFHTPDETHDNIAAYWVPAELPAAGQPLDLSWRLHWAAQDVPRPPAAMVLQTRAGHGWRAAASASALASGTGPLQLHIDFDNPAVARADNAAPVAVGAAAAAAVEPVGAVHAMVATNAIETVETVEAVATGNPNVRGLRVIVQPNTVRGGWRVTLDFERIDPRQPVELRAFLRRDGKAISETWSYAIAAEP